MKRELKYLFLSFLFIVFVTGCAPDKKDKTKIKVSEEEIAGPEIVKKQIKSAKQIFYSLPSPLETAMMLKHSGAKYNFEIMNDVDNVSNYSTNKKMALNLGIYSTDLSYASLYDQTQVTIKYMSVSKKLAEGLGILNAIDDETINKLEENVNNRDVILDIISETLLNTNSYLAEDDRSEIASIILVGGWVEGLFIATNLVSADNLDNELVKRVCDQKLTIQIILDLLSETKEDEDIQHIIAHIHDLKLIYDKITITSSGVTAVERAKSSKIKIKNDIQVSEEDFKLLTEKIREIRNEFTR